MRRFSVLVAAILVMAVATPAFASGDHGGKGKGHDPVTICHRTNSESNPYRVITVDDDAVDGKGGADHFGRHTGPVFEPGLKDKGVKWGDIIPPLSGVHDGLNWTDEGRAIYDNGCKPVDDTPPTPEPPPTTVPPKGGELECPGTLELGQTVIRDEPGTEHVLLFAVVTKESQGLEAMITAQAENNSSVHPGNDLVITSGGESVVLSDVERSPGAVTPANGELSLGSTMTVTLVMGWDGVFSGGMMLSADCPEEPPTTTVPEEPPTTTIPEEPPTTTPPTTEPPTTTIPEEPPTTTPPTTEPPTTEPEFELNASATCDAVTVTSNITDAVNVRVEFRTDSGAIADVQHVNFSRQDVVSVPETIAGKNYTWSVSYQDELVDEGIVDVCEDEPVQTTVPPPNGDWSEEAAIPSRDNGLLLLLGAALTAVLASFGALRRRLTS